MASPRGDDHEEVRRILGTEDTLRASRLLKEWVERGLLEVANPGRGTHNRFYAKPGIRPESLLKGISKRLCKVIGLDRNTANQQACFCESDL